MTVDCGGTVSPPDWILDRRGSGCLFWRRCEPSPGAKSVKFRCEVEVLEFWPTEEERTVAAQGAELRCRLEEIPPPSPLLGAFCMAAVVAILGYQWFIP